MSKSFEISDRKIMFYSLFFVKIKKFAITVSFVNERLMGACNETFNDRARSLTSMSFVILSIAQTAAGSLCYTKFGSFLCLMQTSQTRLCN